MKEFDNRKVAKKHAEYITGVELRRYLADKVHKYVGDNPIIFDGAVGSGQLEQFINAKYIHGVEVQKMACDTFLENYKNADVENISFFNYDSDIKVDAIVMNYPFSLKFNELSEEEQSNIQTEFEWKKSGVVDDIFILKSLKYTKKYGFYICFPGICYRKSELKLRDIIGNRLLELNVIKNAFKDTGIDVVFLVIDKEKQDSAMSKEIYDCKLNKTVHKEQCDIVDWSAPREELTEVEKIDIIQLNKDIAELSKRRRQLEREIDKIIQEEFYPDEKKKKREIDGQICFNF